MHSFLESLPLMALSIIACLHPDQVRALAEVIMRRRALPRGLTPRDPGVAPGYLKGVLAVVSFLGALYAEEFWRCAHHARRSS